MGIYFIIIILNESYHCSTFQDRDSVREAFGAWEAGPALAPCRSVRSAVSCSQHISIATASRSAGFLN